MKICWDSDPLKRPKTSKVKTIIKNWYNNNYYSKYNNEKKFEKHLENIRDEQLRKDIGEFWVQEKSLKERKDNNLLKTSDRKLTHPRAYNTSRLLDFTKNLNDILEQQEKEIYGYKEDTRIEAGISRSIGKCHYVLI